VPTLQFEHAIKDFAMWKAAFDRDPIDRRRLGVRRHRGRVSELVLDRPGVQ
jgi:hypothetical protein